MTADINDRLKMLCEILGRDSFNYVVNIRLYPALGKAGRSLDDIVISALGQSVVVGGAQTATFSALIESLKAGLEYSGDDGSHPNLAFLSSAEFGNQEDEIVSLLHDFFSNAARVVSFWLKEGHPFYSVFWNFAYMVEQGADAYVLIGSSSD